MLRSPLSFLKKANFKQTKKPHFQFHTPPTNTAFLCPFPTKFFFKFCFNITIASQDVSENSTKTSCIAFIQLSQMTTSYIIVQIDIGTIYRP